MAIRKQPFGYRIRNGQIQIAEHEAEVVRMIFDHYTAGMSYGRLADKLNGQAVAYVPEKPWNKNMVARVLQDERYLGSSTYPQIVTPESFQRAKAAKPDVSGTADCAEIKDIRILARCGLCHGPIRREHKDRWCCVHCMNSPVSIKDGDLILCVDRLLRGLCEQPDTITSPAIPADDESVQCLRDSFTHELDKPEFDEGAATAMALSLAAARFNALGSDDYETMRIRYILASAEQHNSLDIVLLHQITSAILIYPTGAVSLKLKNSQITKRSDSA